MYSDITGIILSGGKSSRMGVNKSLMLLNGKPVIETVADLMKTVFANVILISNEPEDYTFLNIPVYKDIFPGLGPLAGIHSGLTHSSTERNFIISCDMPLITSEMICYIADFVTIHPVTVARADGFIQQLCGLYNKSCLTAAENLLKENAEQEVRNESQKKRKCRVLSLIDSVGAEIIDAEKLPFYKKDLFFNMNRPSDFDYVMNKLR